MHARHLWLLFTMLSTLVLELPFISDAGARRFQMSGKWEMRNGSLAIPAENGPVAALGGVTNTGSGPATLMVPPGRFAGNFTAKVPGGVGSLVQLTTAIGVMGPVASAVLAPGSGPGSLTWCPTFPACSLPGEGRIIYRAGANRFGGTIRMGLSGRATNSFVFNASPFQVIHFPQGGTYHRAIGGSPASSVKVYRGRGFVTQPLAAPGQGGLITAPGPKVTTGGGLTTTMNGPTLFAPAVATTPMGFQAGSFSTQFGFGATTGTVFFQQTEPQSDFFTIMGYDKRTALGAGNLQLVAGGLTRRHRPTALFTEGGYDRIHLTFGPPVSSVTRIGAAVAVVALLVVASCAIRQRSEGRD